MIKLINTQKVIHQRIVISGLAIIGITFMIIWQYAGITINQNSYFLNLSNNNFKKSALITPPRGTIYDRNMNVLARGEYAHYLTLTKQNSIPFSLIQTSLSPHIKTDWEKLENEYNQALEGGEINLKDPLTQTEYTTLALNMWSLPNLRFNEALNRIYPFGPSAAHITGYTTTTDNKLIGKNGIELTFNEHLSGIPGWLKITKNAKGQVQAQSEIIPPITGMDIQLTIDANLQQAIYDIMSKYQGTAILVDTQTSEILAAVSLPSYDPNNPFESNETPRSFFNRLTHGLYPPASTVKPFIALEALEQKIIDRKTVIDDPGYYITPNSSQRYNDWLKHGHGKVDVHRAITFSCDTFFYQLAEKMGAYHLSHAMSQFGLGQKTLIELPSEKSGLVPSPSWKNMLGKKWYLGDTINIGIGQGATQVTPLQLAQAIVLLANHGQAKNIHLTKALKDQDNWHPRLVEEAAPISYSPENWTIIDHALLDVLQTGTGHRFKDNPHQIAGKTGTAQVVNIKNHSDDNLQSHDHSLFIGYAPSHKPEIAIVVILEHHPLAVSTANDIINIYFNEYRDQYVKKPH